MKLSRLIECLFSSGQTTDQLLPDGANPDIKSIHYRAQDVKPGGLFVAISGLSADGHDFIDKARKRGAVAVIAHFRKAWPQGSIVVTDSRKALATISSHFYGNPSKQLTIIGITGTNGKTTTSYMIEAILKQAGFSTGVIGTVNYRYGNHFSAAATTTPESLDLQRMMAQMQKKGVTHVVMEISSHAIRMQRIGDCYLDIAVFTNLTQDHLDFHGNMEAYWNCKKQLFLKHLEEGPKKKIAACVINCDHIKGRKLAQEIRGRQCIKVGRDDQNDVVAFDFDSGPAGLRASISMPAGDIAIFSPQVGIHNLENLLCAAGVGSALGLDPKTIKAGLEALHTVPGRLEKIPNSLNRYVYVDYAHTPDALSHVLSTLKALIPGRLITVFGCGGDRDRGKRPQMGKIAAKMSDIAIITSDNPRCERPQAIIEDIVKGIPPSIASQYSPKELKDKFTAAGFVIEAERRKAIRLAVSVSKEQDGILIAGKGHEKYQIKDGTRLPFDDYQEGLAALENQALRA